MFSQETVHVSTRAAFTFSSGDVDDVQTINIVSLITVSGFRVTLYGLDLMSKN